MSSEIQHHISKVDDMHVSYLNEMYLKHSVFQQVWEKSMIAMGQLLVDKYILFNQLTNQTL